MEKYQPEAPPYNRKFQGRLAVIKSFSLKDKVVLDLGCGQGDFVAGLAPHCKHVFGVDSDRKEIMKAHKKCEKFDNVTLIESDIWEALNHLPSVDITLLLSVLHHVMSGNSFYAESRTGYDAALSLLKQIKSQTKVLYLEMGMPYEPRVWADHLPFFISKEFIVELLREDFNFGTVQYIYPPEVACTDTYHIKSFKERFQMALHNNHYNKLSRLPEWFQDMLGFDNRDNRPFFRAS